MSRDDKASYYDLELPDGTVVEAQDVTRALLERAALPPYASKCLGTLLERVWRFSAKPGTDTAREAEKVVTEASFLCEALGGVPSFTLRDVARAAHDAGIEIKFSCDDPAARIAELERELENAKTNAETWERCYWAANRSMEEMERERDALRQTLVTERQAAVATAEELERVRRERNDARQLATIQELDLAALRDRYRPRRQSEEPAPRREAVLIWNAKRETWYQISGVNLHGEETWTHQPPAPGEGE